MATDNMFLNLKECGYVGTLTFHRLTPDGLMFECQHPEGFNYLTFPDAVSAQLYADGQHLLYSWDIK